MSSLCLERHPKTREVIHFPSVWPSEAHQMGLTWLYSESFLRRNKLQHCAMITQNVLAPKRNMGKYLRGGIVGLVVGPKEKKYNFERDYKTNTVRVKS